MSNLFEDAAAWLGERLKENVGLAGVYERAGQQSASITASVAMHDYEVVNEETGIPETVRAYDWTFTPADLVVGAQTVTPRSGDRWKATIAGVLETYEVLPIGKLPCYERLDAHGVLLLVRTKKVA
jgi:hypothetical protein